jgi:hypothetical protein
VPNPAIVIDVKGRADRRGSIAVSLPRRVVLHGG